MKKTIGARLPLNTRRTGKKEPDRLRRLHDDRMKNALAFFAVALVMMLILHANVPRPPSRPADLQLNDWNPIAGAGQAPTRKERATANTAPDPSRAQSAGSGNSDNAEEDPAATEQPPSAAAEMGHEMTRCNLLAWIETAGTGSEP